MSDKDRRSRAFRGAAIAAGGQYGGAAARVVGTALAARSLGAAEFGTATVVAAIPSLANQLVAVKMLPLVVQRIAEVGEGDAGGAYWAAVGIDLATRLLSGLVSVAAVFTLDGLVPQEHRFSVVWFVALGLPGCLWSASQGYALAGERIRSVAATEFTSVLTLAAPVVALSVMGRLSVFAYVVALALPEVALGLGGVLIARDNWIRRPPAWNEIFDEGRRYRKFAFWQWLSVGSSGLVTQGPILMASLLLGNTVAGQFRVAQTVGTATGYIESALTRSFLGQLAQSDRASRLQLVAGLSRREGAAAGIAVAVGVVAVPWGTVFIFGSDYRSAGTIAIPLVLGVAISTFLFWAPALAFAQGHFRRVAGSQFVSAIFILAAGILLFQWSPVAAAAAIGSARAGHAIYLGAQEVRRP